MVVAAVDFDHRATLAEPIARGGDEDPGLATLRAAEEGRGGHWDPLPGTAREGRAVAELLPGATLLEASQATEAALRAVRGPEVLHIASHGYFMEDSRVAGFGRGARDAVPLEAAAPSTTRALPGDPLLRTGIVLAGANGAPAGSDNGHLTAAELAQMDLRGTRLVVLSACETGLGVVRNGEGVMGLRRALQLAGAKAQVLSLWKVGDEATAELMVAFYTSMAEGRSTVDALHEAQRAMLQRPERSAPRDWAAFSLSGG